MKKKDVKAEIRRPVIFFFILTAFIWLAFTLIMIYYPSFYRQAPKTGEENVSQGPVTVTNLVRTNKQITTEKPSVTLAGKIIFGKIVFLPDSIKIRISHDSNWSRASGGDILYV